MYTIVKKRVLNSQVKLFEILAPRVAKKAKPGQFVVLRLDDDGERVPFTISDYDAGKGTVTIVVQEVGKTSRQLGLMNEGESVKDFTGPLGLPTHFENVKKALVIGGGLGSAIAYPQTKNFFDNGIEVDSIVGFRNKDLVILEEEMKSKSTRLFITTDDGTYGTKGFVTEALKKLLEEGNKYDVVVAIGPPIMMKAVCDITRPHGVKTLVSLNPVMIDGTGMCGCCRVSVAGQTRFACIDGPDFDGHDVDFDELMKRNAMYRDEEKISFDNFVDHNCGHSHTGTAENRHDHNHVCKLEGQVNG
jgi:ferredoxin--NADP+ reductase